MRKQFGPPGEGEIPVLEYQMQVCKVVILSFSLRALQTYVKALTYESVTLYMFTRKWSNNFFLETC